MSSPHNKLSAPAAKAPPKSAKRQTRSVADAPTTPLKTPQKTSSMKSWRAHLIRLATQEANTAAALLRLPPSMAPINFEDDAAQTNHTLGGSARALLPPTATPPTAEMSSPPAETALWTTYARLWENFLTRLPLVNSATAAPTSTADMKTRNGGAASSSVVSTVVERNAVKVSAMLRSLNDDWRLFFLRRRLSPAVMCADQYSRRLESIEYPPNMTDAEQRAACKYITATRTPVTGDARSDLFCISVLDFL